VVPRRPVVEQRAADVRLPFGLSGNTLVSHPWGDEDNQDYRCRGKRLHELLLFEGISGCGFGPEA